jgi:hypothetical protein
MRNVAIVVVLGIGWITGSVPRWGAAEELPIDIQRNIVFHQIDDEKLQADLYRPAAGRRVTNGTWPIMLAS